MRACEDNRGIANGQDGGDVEAALRQATKNFQRYVQNGDAGAECALGVAYYFGIGLKQDRTDAEKSLEKAEKRGNAEGHFQRGMMDYVPWNWLTYWATGDEAAYPGREEGEAHDRAEKGFRQASKLGHPVAQDLLDDAKQHMEWRNEHQYDHGYEHEFELHTGHESYAGQSEERYRSAVNLMERRGTDYDFVKGATQLWRLAEKGDCQAQYRLGLAYRDGRFGVEPIFARAEAEKWLRMAAEQGHPDALAALASVGSDGNAD